MTASVTERTLGRAAHSPIRWVIIAAIVGAGLAHLPVIAPHLEEAPYMGVLFIVLTAACITLAAALAVHDSPIVYAAVVLTCGLAVAGYAATRLVAFPMLADDVGNWLEPLGLLSIATETIGVVLAAGQLASHRR